MRITRFAPVLVAALALAAGCSNVRVETDWDPEADFQAFRTWAWIEHASQETDHPLLKSPLLHERVRRAVEDELERLGYDIESRVRGTGRLRFIEVKGRVTGAGTVTVTKNEILTSLNKPDEFILALVEFLDDERHRVFYLRNPFQRDPDFGVTSVNYDFAKLLARAEEPC